MPVTTTMIPLATRACPASLEGTVHARWQEHDRSTRMRRRRCRVLAILDALDGDAVGTSPGASLPRAARADEMTGERDHRDDDDDGGDDHDGLHANGRGREPVDDAGVVGHGVGGGRMDR